jgi:hypothetical protein
VIDDEATILGDSVIESAGRGVRCVCAPIQLATAVLSRPGGDVLDQRSTDSLAAGQRIRVQVLQIADVGGVRVGVCKEMSDPNQALVLACAEPVDLRVSLQPPPGSFVFLVGQRTLIELDVAAEEEFPGVAIAGPGVCRS